MHPQVRKRARLDAEAREARDPLHLGIRPAPLLPSSSETDFRVSARPSSDITAFTAFWNRSRSSRRSRGELRALAASSFVSARKTAARPASSKTRRTSCRRRPRPESPRPRRAVPVGTCSSWRTTAAPFPRGAPATSSPPPPSGTRKRKSEVPER